MNSIAADADHVMPHTYMRLPLALVKGEGCVVYDADGKAYRDFVAGIAVCSLGHANPRIAEALHRQAKTLVHVSNLYYTEPQTRLAEKLTGLCFADRVFFCNSGAEANEAAIKLARKYFYEKGEKGRTTIISMENSFHGRTMATLSATGQEKVRKGYDPLLPGFEFVPFNDLGALEQRLDASVCAVLMEPVQGEGGIICPDPGYLKDVRRLCDETGTLLIFDEIQTGMGRTGTLFAHQDYDMEPDIMTLAKALANGVPMGAMLAKEDVAAAFGPGSHASTFGGTPLVTAAALEVLAVFEEEKICEKCRETGAYFRQKLEDLAAKHGHVTQVRGKGLLLGLALDAPGKPVMEACMEKGFLINCVQENVLRFVPPLIVDKKVIDDLCQVLDEALHDVL